MEDAGLLEKTKQNKKVKILSDAHKQGTELHRGFLT